MWRNLMENLSKQQKIVIGVVVQFIIIAGLALALNNALGGEKIRTFDTDGDETLQGVPDDLATTFRKQLWSVVSAGDDDLDSSEFEYTVREGSYEETNEDGANAVTFLVDVDLLKQTYRVAITWSDEDDATPADILINCPQQSEMKYSETVCRGMYDDTYSLDLYLPYEVYPENDDGASAPNIYISGDEDSKTIEVMVSVCDAEKYKKEAAEYLKKIPNLAEYSVVYYENEIDVECGK